MVVSIFVVVVAAAAAVVVVAGVGDGVVVVVVVVAVAVVVVVVVVLLLLLLLLSLLSLVAIGLLRFSYLIQYLTPGLLRRTLFTRITFLKATFPKTFLHMTFPENAGPVQGLLVCRIALFHGGRRNTPKAVKYSTTVESDIVPHSITLRINTQSSSPYICHSISHLTFSKDT